MTRKPPKHERLLELIRECIAAGRYRDTTHAQQRQTQRKINLPKILHVLQNGRHEKQKDKFDIAFNAWNYAVRGHTIDNQEMRIIVSFEEDVGLLVITAFYLGKAD